MIIPPTDWLDFKSHEAQLGTLPTTVQTVAVSNGYVLLERSQTDAVTFLDHQLNIIHQVALPERSSPHDLVETQNTYWISLYQDPNHSTQQAKL